MYIREQEFQKAFQATKSEHPRINEVLAKSVIFTMMAEQRKKDGVPFPEKIRLVLNECNVFGNEDRLPYRTLLGTFFGSRGGKVAASRRKKKLPPKQKPKKSSISILEKPNGQLYWRI